MLDEYNEAVHSLTDVYRKLLENHIKKLNEKLEPGHYSLNMSSLGIPDFIKDCMNAINQFREIKKRVQKSSSMIEDIVKNIEEAVVLRPYDFEARKDSFQSVMEFYNYFDEHLNRVVSELVDKYNIIGEQLLRNIEENILNKD